MPVLLCIITPVHRALELGHPVDEPCAVLALEVARGGWLVARMCMASVGFTRGRISSWGGGGGVGGLGSDVDRMLLPFGRGYLCRSILLILIGGGRVISISLPSISSASLENAGGGLRLSSSSEEGKVCGQGDGTFQGRSDALEETESFFVGDRPRRSRTGRSWTPRSRYPDDILEISPLHESR